MVVTIVVIVGIIGIGVGFLAYRNRTEKGIESGITSFRRELHALAPQPGEERNAPGRPTADARGVTIMSDAADEPEPATIEPEDDDEPEVHDADDPVEAPDDTDDGSTPDDAPAPDAPADPTDTDERPDA